MARGRTTSKGRKDAGDLSAKANTEVYQYPEASLLARPEIGSQARFKKKKPKAAYRYDSSLA
jgi:adenine-specific DNA-methyltransferase